MCFLAEVHLPDVSANQAGLISRGVPAQLTLTVRAQRAKKDQIGSYFNLVLKGNECVCGVIEHTNNTETTVKVFPDHQASLNTILQYLAAKTQRGEIAISIQYVSGAVSEALFPNRKASIAHFIQLLAEGKVGIPCTYLLKNSGP